PQVWHRFKNYYEVISFMITIILMKSFVLFSMYFVFISCASTTQTPLIYSWKVYNDCALSELFCGVTIAMNKKYVSQITNFDSQLNAGRQCLAPSKSKYQKAYCIEQRCSLFSGG